MHRIKEIMIFCTGLLLCMACTKESQLNMNLQTAIQTVDNDPQEALRLLDEIPSPEHMNHDNYMRYIITLTQARYMDYQDITGDTLILEAQRYFARKQEAEPAARASYYAAAYWCEKEVDDKELEYALLAHYFAKLAENNLFQAKSAHWIGSMYYDRDRLDSARIYYHQAEELYKKETNTEFNLLDNIYMLGQTYFNLYQLEQASDYLNKGLELAKKQSNQRYIALFTHFIGLVCREKGVYSQAKDHFNLALSTKPESEDSLRIYLSYAKLYKVTNQSDSTKYYLDLVKNRIEELSFPYNRLTAYQELALYYEHEGNIKEMKHYLKSVNEEELKIKELKSEAKLQEANERFEAYTRQAEQKYNRVWKASVAVGFVLLTLLAVFRSDRQKLKKRFNKLHQQLVSKERSAANFLPGGLWSINKCMKELNQSEISNNLHMLQVHLKVLNDSFKGEIARSVRSIFEKSRHGTRILAQLTIDDLCIICLHRLDFSGKEILDLLGYNDLPEAYIQHKVHYIRLILAEAGLKKREINRVFRQP